ncbi:hypothetical protein LINPERPRIM_LOCUS38613 [Linum perenne]
MISEVHCDLP